MVLVDNASPLRDPGEVCNVLLPFTNRNWTIIKHELRSLINENGDIIKVIRRLDHIEHLAHVYNPTHHSFDSCPVRMTFVGLGNFLMYCLSGSERNRFLQRVLPSIIDLAVNVELANKTPMYYSYERRGYDTSIPYAIVASLVACAFLCLLPIHPTRHFSLDEPNFFHFFKGIVPPHFKRSRHLLSLISYFEHCNVQGFYSSNSAALRLIRRHLTMDVTSSSSGSIAELPQLSSLTLQQLFDKLLHAIRHIRLPSLFLDKHRPLEKVADTLHLPMTHFVYSYIGNGALSCHPLEDNSPFLRYPDILAVLPVCHRLEDFESVWIDHYRGPFGPIRPGLENSRISSTHEVLRWRRLVLVNSCYCPVWDLESQYSLSSVLSEVIRATAAFSGLVLTEPSKPTTAPAPFSSRWWQSLSSWSDRVSARMRDRTPVESTNPTPTQRLALLNFAWSYVGAVVDEAKDQAVKACLLVKSVEPPSTPQWLSFESKLTRNLENACPMDFALSRRSSLPNLGKCSRISPIPPNVSSLLAIASLRHGRRYSNTWNYTNGNAIGPTLEQPFEYFPLFTSTKSSTKISNKNNLPNSNSLDPRSFINKNNSMTLQSLGNTWANRILKEASALALSYFFVASNCAHQASSSIIQRVINDLSTIKDFTRATQLGCSPSIDKPCIIYSDRSFQRDFSSASPHTLNRVDVSRMTSLDLRGFGCSPGGELSAYLSYFSANHRLSCNAPERASLLPTQPKHSGNSQHCTQVICGRAQLGSETDCGRSVYQAGPDFPTDPKTPIASTSNPKAQSHCGSWLQIFPERVLSCADNIAMDCCIEAMQLARLQRLQGCQLSSVGRSVTRPPGLVTTGWGPDSINPNADSQLKIITQWIAAAVASSFAFVDDASPSLRTVPEDHVPQELSLPEGYLSPLVICTNNDRQLDQLQEVVDLINSSGCTASALLSAVSDYSAYRLRCADSTVRTDLPETAPGAEIMSLFDFLLSRFTSTVNNP